jgi:hypothetical protein
MASMEEGTWAGKGDASMANETHECRVAKATLSLPLNAL